MPEQQKYDYHYGQEAEQYTFFRIPKLLFTHKDFRDLSCEAKVLYGLLLDRMSVSRKNNWIDKQNRVYIIFTIEEIQVQLNCREQKACKLLKQLETCGLLEKKRLGLGKASILYVKNFVSQPLNCENHNSDTADEHLPDHEDDSPSSDNACDLELDEDIEQESQFKSCENHNSGIAKNTSQELRLSQGSNTNPSYLNSSYNNPFSSFQANGTETNRIDSYEQIQKQVKEQINYDILCKRDYIDQDRLQELMQIMVEVLSSSASHLFVDGDMRPLAMVKERYRKIDSEVIQHVLNCLDENKTEVKKVKNYLRTCLYNAPSTMLSQIAMQVNHDL